MCSSEKVNSTGSIILYNYTIQIGSKFSSLGNNNKNNFGIFHACTNSSKICWITSVNKIHAAVLSYQVLSYWKQRAEDGAKFSLVVLF